MTDNTKPNEAPEGPSASKAMLACKECGELEHIYFKHVYQGYRDSVWVIECQRCYSLVPVVSLKYDVLKMTACWNDVQANVELNRRAKRGRI